MPDAPNTDRWQPKPTLLDFMKGPQRAILRLDAERVIGEVNPHIYGHCIEHQKRSIYGGVWTENGEKLREDVLRLIQPLKPPVIRYPGGNFSGGYHWEDGTGPKDSRPTRLDPAAQVEESNQVGTDEFMELCRRTGAEPYLCVNDVTGSAEEAARWVAYCNQDAAGEQGQRRAANGHPEPYRVRLWSVGNEPWSHSDAVQYAARLRAFAQAMRAADPSIRIVAAGQAPGDDDAPAARRWNETVLREAGDLIQYLSFHLYQPGEQGWQQAPDPQAQYTAICAAPLSAGKNIAKLADLIQRVAPGKGIKVALDAWNVWPAPAADAAGPHAGYTLRDALYTAGMLNAFIRQCNHLALANVAQMVNVLPLIVTHERQAYATPIYYPFEMYRQMEPVALVTELDAPVYKSQAFGNIEALEKVPFIDVSATKNRSGSRVVLGIVNRHPTRRVDLSVRLYGFADVQPKKGWLLRHSDPLAENSFTGPSKVKAKEIDLRQIGRKKRFTLDLPPCSVAVVALEE